MTVLQRSCANCLWASAVTLCHRELLLTMNLYLHRANVHTWLTGLPNCVQIDILVVNCSLFNPTPSLSAMIINHFKMRSNIVSYNLAGMGCSAGVIAVNLAKELLQVRIMCVRSFCILYCFAVAMHIPTASLHMLCICTMCCLRALCCVL